MSDKTGGPAMPEYYAAEFYADTAGNFCEIEVYVFAGPPEGVEP